MTLFPRLHWLILGLMVVTLLTPLVRVIAQENSVTYYTQEELPVSLSWWTPEIQLTIMTPDNLMEVIRAVLTLTVSDSDQRGEAVFEIEDKEYRVHPTGTADFEIPVNDLSNRIEIYFTLENRFRGGIEINELYLTLTFTQVTNPPPIADPGGTYYGIEGSEVQFDGSGSYDPDGSIQAYFWDFGDTTVSTQSTPTHTYLDDGEFLVSLTVTDDSGRSTTAATQAIIDDSDPIASFTATPLSMTPLIYRFNDTSLSHDGIEQWLWDFGDGTQSTDPTRAHIAHAYSMPGNYTVILTVFEADGDQSTYAALTPISEDPHKSLTIEIRPKTQAGISGDSLVYFIDVTHHGFSPSPTVTFLLTAQIPYDWNGSLSLPRLMVAPGETRSSLFTLTSPFSAVLGEYGFTITAIDEANSIQTRTVTGSYVLAGSPQVTVSALVDDRPPVRFTVTCMVQPDGILQDIKLYINDQAVKTWTQAGTHTYDWVSPITDPVTYYVTASTTSGLIVSDPTVGVYSLTQAGIPWNLFLYGLLVVVTLFFAIYYGMHH